MRFETIAICRVVCMRIVTGEKTLLRSNIVHLHVKFLHTAASGTEPYILCFPGWLRATTAAIGAVGPPRHAASVGMAQGQRVRG